MRPCVSTLALAVGPLTPAWNVIMLAGSVVDVVLVTVVLVDVVLVEVVELPAGAVVVVTTGVHAQVVLMISSGLPVAASVEL